MRAGLRYGQLMLRTADGTLLPPLDALDRSSEDDEAPALDAPRTSEADAGRLMPPKRRPDELGWDPVLELNGLGGASSGVFMKLR